MKAITFTISDISRLNSLQNRLADNKRISTVDKMFLAEFLAQIPRDKTLLTERVPLNEMFSIKVWDKHDKDLQYWVTLFENLPGWDYCPFSFLVDNDNINLLKENVVIVAWFAPSYSYNSIRSEKDCAYEVWLKDDGTAVFQLPSLQDAEKYPELYNFKGTWKEAYYLLIETLKKGWPMEEFPDELLPLLKK